MRLACLVLVFLVLGFAFGFGRFSYPQPVPTTSVVLVQPGFTGWTTNAFVFVPPVSSRTFVFPTFWTGSFWDP